ncbi:hypothetical protein LUZ60_004338 [Juncus effusus]|nr:hypothetical protein LUZ60_004338 [Juncus effusus]
MAGAEAEQADEWEICNDSGFVYKRRRRDDGGQPSASASAPAEAAPSNEAELRRGRRARRRKCLVGLRGKYRREMEQWERIYERVMELNEGVPVGGGDLVKNGDALRSVADLEDSSRFQAIDELLAQVESQEAILRKINEICDNIDALCEQKQEKLFNSMIALPIWENSQTLYESLTA